MRRRTLATLGLVLVMLAVVVDPARAQNVASGIIAGSVKDASGGVLPGVTVEVASPALIEKTRTAVTDEQGLYRIIDLRAGVYTVTFTLPGFATTVRDGLELSAGFTASVNAEMKLGTLEETITVTTATPVVDVQNVLQKTAISNEERASLPLPSNSGAYVTLIPGATQNNPANQDVGGARSESTQQFTINGNSADDYQQLRDGMFFGTMLAAGNYMSAVNPTALQEVTIVTGGGITAESESGGVLVNIVPRDGGNLTRGSFVYNFGSKALQSNNINDALRARGASAPTEIRTLYEVAGGLGGPLLKDRLWYFADSRKWVSSNNLAGQYYNKLQGSLFYEPDLSRPAYDLGTFTSGSIRLTAKVSEKDVINWTGTIEKNCDCFLNIANGLRAPEATSHAKYWPNWRTQATWSRPFSSKFLLQAGMTIVKGQQHGDEVQEGGSFTDRSVLDTSRNFRYGAPGQGLAVQQAWGSYTFGQRNQHVSLSYVTGSHSIKVGLQHRDAPRTQEYFINDNMSFTFNGRTPTSVTYFAGPLPQAVHQRTIGTYIQDQWTLNRLTLNYGVRLDVLNADIPEQRLPGGPYGLPVMGTIAPATFAALPSVLGWRDVTPRIGGAYDVFGNGKTAVKAYLAQYVAFQSNAGLLANINPLASMVTAVTRTWSDANGNYVPEEAELGPLSNNAFGTIVQNTTYSREMTHGWSVRPNNWQGSVSVQQELRNGVALNIGYFRTWYNNFTVTDNLAVGPSDFNEFCFNAPTDPRLPENVSGKQICGLYDINPNRFGQVNNEVVPAEKFGKQTRVYNGASVSFQARLGKGRLIQGGVSTGRTVTDRCFVVDSPGELYNCKNTPPWSAGTQVKLSAIYPLPYGFQASAVYQNLPGIPTSANITATNAQVSPSLGRNLGSCGSRIPCNGTVTIAMINPGEFYSEPRGNQVDVRLTRRIHVVGLDIEPEVNFYNVFNANNILTMNQTFGPSWQNVTALLAPRLIKFGARVVF